MHAYHVDILGGCRLHPGDERLPVALKPGQNLRHRRRVVVGCMRSLIGQIGGGQRAGASEELVETLLVEVVQIVEVRKMFLGGSGAADAGTEDVLRHPRCQRGRSGWSAPQSLEHGGKGACWK